LYDISGIKLINGDCDGDDRFNDRVIEASDNATFKIKSLSSMCD